jgi:hypothetical protein
MAKISWNPKGRPKGQPPAPVAWSCYIYMREDGSFSSEFKGETGHMMMMAAIDVLHKIRSLRQELPCTFGLSPDEFDPPEKI